tara:strand:+ start:977 stop:2053 length:1077 start_codon:yes stop_codon:yes gene_type:complete
MTTRKLFICEKPDIAKKLQPFLNENDLIILSQPIGVFKFNYQNISFSEAPYTKEKPQYKIDFNAKNIENSCITAFNKSGKVRVNFLEYYYSSLKNNKEVKFKDIDNFFNNFDEIVNCCDADYSGARAFDFKFSKYFKLGDDYLNYFQNKKLILSTMYLYILLDYNIKESFSQRYNSKNYQLFLKHREEYQKKDFFEYNYNLNSLLFFSKYIKNIVLTKNMIQTLLLFKNELEFSDSNILFKMDKKKIGTAASRYKIIEELNKSDIIEQVHLDYYLLKTKEKRIKSYFRIAKQGQFLLNEIMHKKIKDPHLSERLNADIFGTKNNESLSFEDFYNKYEQYLYTVFSKQKRFLNKKKADS